TRSVVTTAIRRPRRRTRRCRRSEGLGKSRCGAHRGSRGRTPRSSRTVATTWDPAQGTRLCSRTGISYRAPVETVAVLLAAGKGTRMRSDLAKVLHQFCGEPLVMHPLRAAARFGVARSILVIGHQAEAVREAVSERFPE